MTQTTDNVKQKPRRVRGTALFNEDDSMTFTPYQEAPSTQRDVKTCAGGGKRWTTTGADPSRVVHLMVKESAIDQYAELAKQFAALTKDMKPAKPLQLPEKQRVVNEGGMEVYLDPKQGRLTYKGEIDLNTTHNWQSDVMRQLQVIVRTLPADEKFKRVVNRIKKGGLKV